MTALGLDLIAQRPADYGSHVRLDLIESLPAPLGRVLDVGCGEAAGADALRARGAEHLTGIEMDPAFAAVAETRYDEVVTGSATGELPWEDGSFDTILCYDILEHLYDPWSLVRTLRGLLKPSGHLHVSLPNARSRMLLWPLLRHGTFAYAPAGVLDVTHFRFFTKRDARAMLEAAGFDVLRISHPDLGSRKRLVADRITKGLSTEFLVNQWFLLARPR